LAALVECVPNFSEGRQKAVIDAIVSAIAAHPVHVLDISSDGDHHRTVVTFVGAPDVIVPAMLDGARVATQLIDLNAHQGVHPRMGAVDVVPFIPLHETDLATCIDLAHAFGARAARELQLPVYLYEAAATRPERRNLAEVRRGGFERLKSDLGRDPALTPDYGIAQLSRAGAIITGARLPLIAFNVFLHSPEVTHARVIADRIRESNGGLPCVKALGLLVNGMAQVSMNLTNYQVTGLYSVVRAINAEAESLGVQVSHAELIGLVPQQALLDFAFAQLGSPPMQPLEVKIGAATGDFRPILGSFA
jgi:glutamate formiminotransferase